MQQDHGDIDKLLKKHPLDMTPVMQAVEEMLPALLQDEDGWQSLMIDYQPPYLMRIYRQVGNIRVNLHYFLPAEILPEARLGNAYDENLYHPHAWASAMRILEGEYEQWMGFADRRGIDVAPQKTLHLVHKKGDSYAMNHPWLWHQVIPKANMAVSTLMVTHIPESWDQDIPKSTKPLRCLSEQERRFMFEHFKTLYPLPAMAKPQPAKLPNRKL